MGIETLAVVGTVVSVAASVAGGIMSYQSQQSQANNAQKIAAYNASVQQQQADMQSRLAIRQAQINNQFLQQQYNQTSAYDNQAAAIKAQADEEVRRNQERQQQVLSKQRAAYANAGVLTDTGSPLAVLADTAGLFELQNQDTQYDAKNRADALVRQGALARSGLNADMYTQDLNQTAANYARKAGNTQADLTRLTGNATAQGYRNAAYGSLLSGVGSIGSGIRALA